MGGILARFVSVFAAKSLPETILQGTM